MQVLKTHELPKFIDLSPKPKVIKTKKQDPEALNP